MENKELKGLREQQENMALLAKLASKVQLDP